MRRADRIFGLICLGLSVWSIVEGLRFDFRTKFTPGPGFSPVCVGVVLGLFALWLIFNSYMRKGEEEDEKPILPGWAALRRVGLLFLILVGYTAVLFPVGFFIATWAMVFLILFLLEEYSPVKSVLYSVLFSGVTILVFQKWMEVRLPKGWLGLGF